jgi:hypothetical protein
MSKTIPRRTKEDQYPPEHHGLRAGPGQGGGGAQAGDAGADHCNIEWLVHSEKLLYE